MPGRELAAGARARTILATLQCTVRNLSAGLNRYIDY